MSTETAELVMSVESLDGILETPFFKSVVPVTQDEEDQIRDEIKSMYEEDGSPDTKEGDLVGPRSYHMRKLFSSGL